LQPYICLFDHCPSTLFASRHAWFEHELAAHRKEWACGICNARTKSASAFVEHAQSIHQRTFPEKILPKILQQNERAQTRYKVDDCPFCDDWVVNHDDKDIPEDDLYVTVKQFRQHVGRHMEELALFVLPLELGDDFESQKAAGEVESFDRSQDTSEIHEFDNPDEPAAQMAEELVNACKQGHLNGVKKFLEAGGYVDIEFGDGSTPLLMAVENGSVKVATLLLSAGANIYHVSSDGETVFTRAVRCQNTTLLSLLWEVGAHRGTGNEDGETLLMAASGSHGSVRLLASLIEEGADVSAKDKSGRTALLHFLTTNVIPEAIAEAALLVLGRPPVDLEAADDTHHGFRALHWIAWHGMTRTCRKFLQLGADIDGLDREGNTPLRIAIRRDQKEVALLLLDMGADPGEMYPTNLRREASLLLGWASSNDRLHIGQLVVHRRRMLLDGENGEGILRRVSKVIRVDSP
jgi:ankyrin repeat protein